jgi:hypothetical protein
MEVQRYTMSASLSIREEDKREEVSKKKKKKRMFEMIKETNVSPKNTTPAT